MLFEACGADFVCIRHIGIGLVILGYNSISYFADVFLDLGQVVSH